MVENPPASAGDTERFPRGGDGNPLPYACLGNALDRPNWKAAVHGGNKESEHG